MSTAIEIATLVLPHLKDNVLKGWTRTYGYYANAIGRTAAKDSMAVGMAMHTIGAACVFCCIPIIPLHFVESTNEKYQGIFDTEYSERNFVKPHWAKLVVTSRDYKYTDQDFRILQKALEEILPTVFSKAGQSPKSLWRYIIYQESPGEGTWLNRALSEYEEIFAQLRAAKNAP